MKKCPKCQSVYTDDDLLYCLSDGTLLDAEFDPDKTIRIEPEGDLHGEETIRIARPYETDYSLVSPTVQGTEGRKQVEKILEPGISRVDSKHNPWTYTTIALVALILGGAGVFFVLRLSNESQKSARGEKSATETQSGRPRSAAGVEATVQPGSQTRPVPPVEAATPAAPVAAKPGTYKVVGVAANDVLYIRPSPGDLKSSVGSIPSNATGVQVTGSGVRSGRSVWSPVSYSGLSGWVNSRFLEKE
jgi:hypothetical protein